MKPCKCCGTLTSASRKVAYRGACGYCGRCYRRWYAHGCPESGPPPPLLLVAPADRAGRIEDYRDLLSWGVAREEAARRLGVSLRTLIRYDSALAGAA